MRQQLVAVFAAPKKTLACVAAGAFFVKTLMPFLRNYMLKYAQNRPVAIQDDEDGMPLPLKRMQNSQEKIKQDSLNRAQEILHPLHWLVDIDLIDTIRYPHWNHWMET